MYVDFKITCWERVVIPEERKEEIQERIKDGTIESSNDLLEYLDNNEGDGGIYEGVILETEEQMGVEENNGEPTIDMGEKGNESCFTNVFELN